MRSHLPWPLRWAVAAVVLGFSAAIALWAFEFGKDIAGLDRGSKEELARLRGEIEQLKSDHARARQVADTADSLLKTERAAQQALAQQLRQAEADKQAMQADLNFFERLLPSANATTSTPTPAPNEGLQLRGLQAEAKAPGQLRYQMLVVQSAGGGRPAAEFKGSVELLLSGQLDGKPWKQAMPGGPQPLQLRQYTRVEGMIDHPEGAVIKTVQARVLDAQGAMKAQQTLKL